MLTELADQTGASFAAHFGQQPKWLAAAPGRVNLIGEHTDYNDGFVFPMAIERHTVLAAAPNDTNRMRLRSFAQKGEVEIDLDAPLKPGKPAWANYVRGVLAGFLERVGEFPGFDAVINSDVPLGGGLSSSAALEVATATLLEAITGRKLELVDKALLAQRAEHEFAGVPCGIMDQFTSVMAKKDHLLLIDCRSRTTECVPLQDPSISVLMTNSNVRHELTGGEYAQRRAQCENAASLLGVSSLRDASLSMLNAVSGSMESVMQRRAQHVITEIERTLLTARAMRENRWSDAGKFMYDSHASLRDAFEVSCPELDLLVQLAQELGEENGVLGSRMTGGGFGGCTVSLVRTEAVERINAHLSSEYKQRTGIEPSSFLSRPAAGAQILKSEP